jgi:hypothetical protein
MDYFSAVQEGRARVRRAVGLLEQSAGPSSPVLFLKMGAPEWSPVGEESLLAVVEGKGSTAAVVVCDAEGNSKAISGWMPKEKAEAIARAMRESGIAGFEGELRLPI